jgi:hypothetical protein
LDRRLRAVDPLKRPANSALVRDWLTARYKLVRDLNTEHVGAADARPTGEPSSQTRATARAAEGLQAAHKAWESAYHEAAADLVPWPLLGSETERVNQLVKHWWTYAINDPGYWAQSGHRGEAFDLANSSPKALSYAIATRGLGTSRFRYGATVVVRGRRATNAEANRWDAI